MSQLAFSQYKRTGYVTKKPFFKFVDGGSEESSPIRGDSHLFEKGPNVGIVLIFKNLVNVQAP
ncbi:hypothetical protein Daus18300_014407 [Diaporthe australafricana]|uniref:Uncharacterized protein n=1 Tax=Diaporthe australafricana TaxID=127596 RepID=A0ABR3VVB1_9PEZI